MKPNWKEVQTPIPGCRAYAWGNVHVLVEYHQDYGWHVSISTPYREPTWTEIREARYAFVPDAITMVMVLPPRAEYVNLHPFCFHLYQERECYLKKCPLRLPFGT